MSSYIIRQFLVIIALYILGAAFNVLLYSVSEKARSNKMTTGVKDIVYLLLLAYPSGLALYGISGFLLLLTGIHFNILNICIVLVIIFGILLVCNFIKKGTLGSEAKNIGIYMVVSLVIVAVVSYICCSGVIGISLSNDSYYYYSVYPQTIVTKGQYLRSFDVFLTDVGQITAVIGTLPFLFGFEEIFGIQLFLGLNLTGVFAVSVYEKAAGRLGRRQSAIFTIVVTLAMITATPYVVMTRWILANVYFMSFLFFLFIITVRLADDSIGKCWEKYLILLFMTTLSMIRMEGGMMACLLILSAAFIENIKSKDLAIYYLLPVALTQSWYYAVVYLKIKVDPLYSFLNYKNVFVMLGLIAAVYIYLLLLRDRVAFLKKYYTLLMLAALVGGNLLLAVISTERYMGNLKFFALNILLQNGWGFFGLSVIVLLILFSDYLRFNKMPEFPLVFTIGFVLFTVAVCWARDGTLRVGIGDSGNRVLMQVIPFIIYSLAQHVIEILASIDDTIG